MSRPCTIILIAMVSFILIGCEKNDEKIAFQPTLPQVDWYAISPSAVNRLENSYRIVVEQPTTGVFPLTVAIARVKADDRGYYDKAIVSTLALNMKPVHDFLRWNSAFDDFRRINEAYPLNWIAMDALPITIGNLVDAADTTGGNTCLIYTQADISADESEVFGVLYQCEPQRPLVVLHARGVWPPRHLSEDQQKDLEKNKYYSPDEDPNAQPFPYPQPRTPRLVAEDRFEALLRKALVDLREQDQSPAPEVEEGWVPEGPTAPIFWPPLPDEYYYYNPYPADL